MQRLLKNSIELKKLASLSASCRFGSLSFSPESRPHRSILFTPGSNERALNKAKDVKADGIIIDLEDAVAPDIKETARELAVKAVKTNGFGRKLVTIRVNALKTPWGCEDLRMVSNSGVHAIVIPKVESVEDVTMVATLMNMYGAPKQTGIWAMIETPRGVLNAKAIARAHRRVTALVVGTSDLSKELRCATTPDRHALLTSLRNVVLAARSQNVVALDGVHLDLHDDVTYQAVCRQAKEMGFDGKTLIHPKTIDFANEMFAPSGKEVENAKKIIAAFTEAQARGEGVAVVNGQLIENLHVESAQRVVDLHLSIEALTSMPS